MEELTPESPDPIDPVSGIPYSLIHLKERFFVQLLKYKGDIDEYGERHKFTRAEVAYLAECSPTAVKEAIKEGRLVAGTSGWIMREALKDWLGKDPINQRISAMMDLQREAILLDRMISQLFPQNDQKRPIPPIGDPDVQPA